MAGLSIESLLLGEPDDLTTPEKASALAGALKRKQDYGLLGQLMNLEPTRAAGGALQEQAQVGLQRGLAQQAGAREAKAAAAKEAAAQKRWQQEFAATQAYRGAQLANARAGLDIRKQAAADAAAAKQAALDARNQAAGIKARGEQEGVISKRNTGLEALRQVDRMLAHPGRTAATGKTELLGYVPWTDARGYRAELDKLRGQAFLEAFNSLRGGGQITEAEGKKATAAMTTLASEGLSEADHEAALNELRRVIANGIARSEQQAATLGIPAERLQPYEAPGTGDPENLGEF